MKVNGLEYVELIIDKCETILSTLEKAGKAPNNTKKIERKFSVNEASDLVGKSRVTLNKLERDGIISPEKSKNSSNRTVGYSLNDINKLRKHFGNKTWRDPGDPCLKVAVQSFKGGVAKSVTSIHMAQYLAIQGMRVLLVDCDPQASATSSFGFMPDKNFDASNTLLPYLQGKQKELAYCVIDTYFPGVSLIPSCLPFYDAEFQLAFAAADAETVEERYGYFSEFVHAFDTIEKHFDIIIIDSPPALGMITINILTSADAVIVPTPPALYDFASTVQYFKMIKKIMGQVIPDKQYSFIKILATKVDARESMQVEFLDLMREVFGKSMFNSVFLQTTEIQKCAAQFKTVYDITKPQARALNILDSVFKEVEFEIKKCWPSMNSVLIEEGVI